MQIEPFRLCEPCGFGGNEQTRIEAILPFGSDPFSRVDKKQLKATCKSIYRPIKLFIMADQRKAVIKNADMSEAMQQDAVDVASVALSKYNIEKVRGC